MRRADGDAADASDADDDAAGAQPLSLEWSDRARGVLRRRRAAEARLGQLEARWGEPPRWDAAGASPEVGAELAVMGWDLAWFESSLRRRAGGLLRQEQRLVASHQYRDWYKLLEQMSRLERRSPPAAHLFPACVETDPEYAYPMELVPQIAAALQEAVRRWSAKPSRVWQAYASMFGSWAEQLCERHADQWDRLIRKADLELSAPPGADGSA